MKHVLFDLKQCLMSQPLDDEEYVKETLIEAWKRVFLICFALSKRSAGQPFRSNRMCFITNWVS